MTVEQMVGASALVEAMRRDRGAVELEAGEPARPRRGTAAARRSVPSLRSAVPERVTDAAPARRRLAAVD